MAMMTLPDIVYGRSTVDSFEKGFDHGRKRYDIQTLKDIGQRAMTGDYAGAQAKAFERGDLNSGFKMQQVQDQRTDRANSQSDRSRELEKKLALDAAGLFQNYVDKEQDPARRAAMTQQLLSAHPELSPRLQRYGVKVDDPAAVSQFFRAQAQGYQDPMETQKNQLDIDYKRAQIGNLNNKRASTDDPVSRAALAKSLGLDENSDTYRTYVMTGRVPRESEQQLTSTDKKAIFAAEDELPVIKSTLDALKRAKDLNTKSFSGYGAGVRASIGSKLPDAIVPDFIADKAGADASNEFGSLMSFESIKAMSDTLKGATTDRELAQFVEILGNPSTPPDIRERTIDRMISLANAKLSTAKNRMNSLVDGTYYKPGGGADPAPGPQPAPSGVGGTPLRAGNPQTGQVIEWDGQQWMTVQ
jgi:hypothetical protein